MEPYIQYLSLNSAPGDLHGAKGRLITGFLNITFGIADVVIPIIMSAVAPTTGAVVGFGPLLIGISFLVLSITAGCFGICSRRGKCQTITYLVLCVFLAIFTAANLVFSAVSAVYIRLLIAYGYYGYGGIYVCTIFDAIVNALHCVVAIAGASFTCGAVCCISDTRVSQQPMSVQPLGMQPPPQPPMAVAHAAMAPAYNYPAMQ